MHIPNCLVPVSILLRIMSRYLGSNTCRGQGTVGYAIVQTNIGTFLVKLQENTKRNICLQNLNIELGQDNTFFFSTSATFEVIKHSFESQNIL